MVAGLFEYATLEAKPYNIKLGGKAVLPSVHSLDGQNIGFGTERRARLAASPRVELYLLRHIEMSVAYL